MDHNNILAQAAVKDHVWVQVPITARVLVYVPACEATWRLMDAQGLGCNL